MRVPPDQPDVAKGRPPFGAIGAGECLTPGRGVPMTRGRYQQRYFRTARWKLNLNECQASEQSLDVLRDRASYKWYRQPGSGGR